MLFSLAAIFIFGMLGAAVFSAAGAPRIIGMLAAGIILALFGIPDPSVLAISTELRQMALIIILIRAGLSLDLSDLKKVGRPAVLMSFLPACAEILAYILLAPSLLGLTRTEAAVMGAVLSAVSPAVVVPRMVALIEKKCGTQKGIPQMILAGASCDDVFVIVLFSVFVTAAQGGNVGIADLMNIPISAVCGVAAGIAAGFAVYFVFKLFRGITGINKVIIMLSAAFVLMAAENFLKPYIAFSGLLAVIAAACVIKKKSDISVSEELSGKLAGVWTGAEILLFVLVGAAVDIKYTLEAGIPVLIMIFAALIFRSAGVLLCLAGTKFTVKEKIFCIIAYLPKATVQAAIGAVPLSLGLPCGKAVLSAAVAAILITAPLGAFGIDKGYKKLL